MARKTGQTNKPLDITTLQDTPQKDVTEQQNFGNSRRGKKDGTGGWERRMGKEVGKEVGKEGSTGGWEGRMGKKDGTGGWEGRMGKKDGKEGWDRRSGKEEGTGGKAR